MLFSFLHCVGLFTNGSKAVVGKSLGSLTVVTCHYILRLQRKLLKANKSLNLTNNIWMSMFLIILWPNGWYTKKKKKNLALYTDCLQEKRRKKTTLVWLSQLWAELSSFFMEHHFYLKEQLIDKLLLLRFGYLVDM